MIKLLLEALRRGLPQRRNSAATHAAWQPVAEESPYRRLSAPSPELCAITDIGKRRRQNEDTYFLSADRRLWIIADGMGGHAAGELASTLAVQAIVEAMKMNGESQTPADAGERLMRAFAFAHNRVASHSQDDDKCYGMGCTAIVGTIEEERLAICHVGDVRAYHASNGRMKRITNDHSWVWENLVMQGLLTPEQARSHPQRAHITQAVGTRHGIRPGLNRVRVKRGDRILLCSDGLWEAVSENDIRAVLGAHGSMKQLATALVDRANAAGGDDNITVIIYEHTGPL